MVSSAGRSSMPRNKNARGKQEGVQAAREGFAEKASERAALAERLVEELAGKLKEAEHKMGDAEKRYKDYKERYESLKDFLVNAHGYREDCVRDDGDVFEGFVHNGVPEGWGVCEYKDGGRYVGQWKRGKPEGYGKMAFKEGTRFEGEWASGGYHGRGVYHSRNGERFEGTWHDDRRHGTGIHILPDGRRYREVWRGGNLVARTLISSSNDHSPREGGNDATCQSQESSKREEQAHRKFSRRFSDPRGERSRKQPWEEGVGAKGKSNAFAAATHGGSSEIRMADIDWPRAKNLIEHLAGGSKASHEDKRRATRELQRRWHPDRWQGKNLAPQDRDRILHGVKEVFQRIELERDRLGIG